MIRVGDLVKINNVDGTCWFTSVLGKSGVVTEIFADGGAATVRFDDGKFDSGFISGIELIKCNHTERLRACLARFQLRSIGIGSVVKVIGPSLSGMDIRKGKVFVVTESKRDGRGRWFSCQGWGGYLASSLELTSDELT